MSDFDAAAFEENLIADMRAHDGAVTTGSLTGHPLLIMSSRGAKSGEPRRAILTFTRDGADYIVAGSASGSPTDPSWLSNVQANPAVTIEAEGRTFEATGRVVDDAEHERLWARHVAALPHFAEYPEKAGRTIPVVRLTPNSED